MQDGYQHSSKKRDSITGLPTLKIGVSLEIDTGVTQSQSGFLKIWKKLYVLVQLKNFKNYQVVEKSLISIEKVLIILPFHQSKEKEFLKEFQKYSIAGSSQVLCHSLKSIIHSACPKKPLTRDSQPTLLLKVLTKPEVGSIP